MEKALFHCIRVVLSGVKDVCRPMGSSLARPTKQLNVIAAAFYGDSSARPTKRARMRLARNQSNRALSRTKSRARFFRTRHESAETVAQGK